MRKPERIELENSLNKINIEVSSINTQEEMKKIRTGSQDLETETTKIMKSQLGNTDLLMKAGTTEITMS